MDVYIYDADIYCDACGEQIMKDIQDVPSNPDDQASYDSGEYPKGPYPDGGGEADCPQHCGSGSHCKQAIELAGGIKVGAFLENPLTHEGVYYVKEAISISDTEITQLWAEFYAEELSYD